MDLIGKLSNKNLVLGLPKLKYTKDKIWYACQKGKQVKTCFESKNVLSTLKPLELLHMDLIGPSRTKRYRGNYYVVVVMDDYSRFKWTLLLVHKSNTFEAFKKLVNVIENQKGYTIVSIRINHGKELENKDFTCYYGQNGINYNFLAPWIYQQLCY